MSEHEFPMEETTFWIDASRHRDALPEIGVSLTWTRGWKPALRVHLWDLVFSVGWHQP